MPSKLSSETARQRELYKYWQPTHASVFPKAEYDSTFNSNNYQPRASYDAALTAYAQLGALRCNAKRGMVSVVDATHQYIIAESTKSLSLQHGKALDPKDQLWFGLRAIPRHLGICAAALGDFTVIESNDSPLSDSRHNYKYVIEDLEKDVRFEHQPFVRGAPFLRFYAGVPIRSPAGYLIGIFSIVDDKPRHDFTNADVEILKDLAATVMDHLVLGALRGQQSRSAQMVKGLGLFVEGKKTMRDWWLTSGHLGKGPAAIDGSRGEWTLDDQADAEFGVQRVNTFDVFGRPSPGASIPEPQSIEFSIDGSNGGKIGNDSLDTLSITSTLIESPPSAVQQPVTSCTSPQGTTQLQPENGKHSTCTASTYTAKNNLNTKPPHNSDDDGNGPSSPEDAHSIYLRASHLIRESLSVEGCAFLDASVTVFENSMVKVAAGAGTLFVPSESKALCGSSERDDTEHTSSASSSPQFETLCEVLGLSVKNVVGNIDTVDQGFSFPADLLQRCLVRYPQGKIFNFEDDGTMSSSEDDEGNVKTVKHVKRKARRTRMKPTEQKDNARMIAVLPGVRSVAFLPLWDSDTKRWSAAGFVWTRDPIRILDAKEDLGYLSSFCNNIMAENRRINAKRADTMKGNFISSVSHELRSPLHGILASAEHLQDMSLGAAAEELISMINSCSKMLMDTIDSVLDFTKLNNAKKPESILSQGAKSPDNKQPFDSAMETTEVDLSALTEEVVGNILSGYNFGKAKSDHSTVPVRTLSTSSSVPEKLVSEVLVLVSIDPRADWVFKTQPGTWRRVLMNLFGNALKYTKTGRIQVDLACHDKTSEQGLTTSSIVLSVYDTGVGISPDFLKHHLFTPFSQEDSLAPGTGLGLSIVRQLVEELSGQIEMKSEKDAGTEATVRVTFHQSSQSNTSCSALSSPIRNLTKGLEGMSACLLGFDISPNIEDVATGILSIRAEQTLSLKAVLTRFLRGWCGMELQAATALDSVSPDIYITLDTAFEAILHKRDLQGSDPSTNAIGTTCILVLCTTSTFPEQAVLESQCCVVFVEQPFGPHKFAKALNTVFKKAASRRNSSSMNELELPLPNTLRPRLVPSATVSSAEITTVNVESSNEQIAPDRPVQLLDKEKLEVATGVISLQPKRPTVLLVDDNAINLKLLVMYMGKLGFPFKTATDGLEALLTFQNRPGDIKIILMDISMPVMDGLTSTREIRKYEHEHKLNPCTIIAVTGAASDDAQREATLSGIDQFITKPVPLKKLKSTIEMWESKQDDPDRPSDGEPL
ncbi:hypothetical protein BJ878DRAFT_527708 [Calycina marina]|uniref:Uncharacterized protein n=1 Tax=Calycina marina TaxID=1763456 RepID=A0A9P8CAS4_9HELO|nr:hypothetical protein BJ878DRAFT_527708 [Calycina marina]